MQATKSGTSLWDTLGAIRGLPTTGENRDQEARMPLRIFAWAVAWMVVLGSGVLPGQTKSPALGAPGRQEFPVTLRQNVVAGKTAVGTKVEARLQLATLVKGTVIPEGAIFSGEVIESAAKTATDPSRLAIRIDSVQWKKGSAPIKAYLTEWYYPPRMALGDASSDADDDNPVRRAMRGSTAASPNIPGGPVPPLGISDKRVVMKDVESAREGDGVVTLSSKRSNIKLDRSTTYVLAAEERTAGK